MAGALVISIIAGLFTDAMQNSIWAYSALLISAGAIGFAGVYILSLVPEVSADENFSLSALAEPYRDRNFRHLMLFSLLWSFGLNLTAPFFTVYMLVDMDLSVSTVVALSALSQIANVVFLTAWGKVADSFGNRPVLSASCPIYAFSLVLWTFTTMPQKHAFTMGLLVMVHILMGVATAGTSIAASNIALKLAPKGRATAYLAANSVISSLGLGLAPLLGGFLADFFKLRGFSLMIQWHAPSRVFSLYALSFEHWDFLFFLSFLIILYALHRLSRVREGDAVENRVVLRDVFNEVRRTARSFSTIGGVQQAFPYPAALSQEPEERLNSNDNDLSGGEVMVVKREMTKKFLEDAYAGESMAHMRYAIFAEKAEKEGLKNISNLFRAVSFAELVHARNHYNALGHLKDTPNNLQTCIDGEHFENTEMYPVYNNTAKLQEESEAQRSTHYALEAEKIHEKLYTEAKKIAEQKKDVDYKKVYICPVCGYTVIGEAPDKCPVCGTPKEKFRLFEA